MPAPQPERTVEEVDEVQEVAPVALVGPEGLAHGPALSAAAAPGGYAWWYCDAVGRSATGERYALTIILFAGAVFSPTYARRVRAGERDSGLDHPAVNIALTRKDDGRELGWVMNEHPAAALRFGDDGRSLTIGQSGLRYEADGSVVFTLDEIQTLFGPRPGPRLCGTVRLVPQLPPLPPQEIGRSPDGREVHCWRPLAARSAAEIELRVGDQVVAFRGTAYHDSNYGSGRLERAFARWAWAHGAPGGEEGEGADPGREELILYRTCQLDGAGRSLEVRLRPEGARVRSSVEPFAVARVAERPGRFLWLSVPPGFAAGGFRCAREPRSRLVDAPFYARFAARLSPDGGAHGGDEYRGIGEYLDLRRFDTRVVQFMLGYKTQRVGGSTGEATGGPSARAALGGP